MFDVYRLSTFLVHTNNSHKHPPGTLITNTSVAQDETPPSVRTAIGELDKQEAQKTMRLSTLKSKGTQPETQVKVPSDTPPKIEAPPHENSVGTWLSATISKRKTTHKTTAKRPSTQTTIDDFYLQEDHEDDNESEPKRPKLEKHAFTTSVQEQVDYNEETINLIDETMNMCRKEIPGSIAMIVDSGASHILLRQEHAHVLPNVICNTSTKYATITCAKQGAKITVIGTGSLTIGRFHLRAFICRDDELQYSLLGLNPLMEKGCTAEFTDKFFKLNHTACLQPVLTGYKYLRPTLWRVSIPPAQHHPTMNEAFKVSPMSEMTDVHVSSGQHDSSMTKGIAASVVEIHPLLSASAEPLRDSPSTAHDLDMPTPEHAHDLDMSTPEHLSTSHALDVSRMGQLVSFDEFSSHTTHRPPQIPTDDHTITSSAYIQRKPKVGDKVESRCKDGRRHCDATGLGIIDDKHYSVRYYGDNVEDTTTHSNQPTARMTVSWFHKELWINHYQPTINQLVAYYKVLSQHLNTLWPLLPLIAG
jgi:hypothetical protein